MEISKLKEEKLEKDIAESDQMVIDEDYKSENTYMSNPIKEKEVDNISELNDSQNEDLKFFSKRILCELIKSEPEECEKKQVIEIANNLNPLLDIILNKNKAKLNQIQNYITYFVELDSELIKTLPEYNAIKEEFVCRFIISAKNIYNFAFEVYFSLYDLYNVRISLLHTF